MVGASKILTVSYGTFSCTLEGFDDSFGTMKAIAEYFRDLAADDRYFGAEPPTPDAEMLQRIAEREIRKRVEARIQDDGVVLRADAGLPAAAPRQHPAEPAAESAAPIAEPEPETAEEAPAPVQEPAAPEAAQPEKPAEPLTAVATPTAPADATDISSVAAKLARIRAVVGQGGAVPTPTPAPDYVEDFEDQDLAPAAETAGFVVPEAMQAEEEPQAPAETEIHAEAETVEVEEPAETPVEMAVEPGLPEEDFEDDVIEAMEPATDEDDARDHAEAERAAEIEILDAEETAPEPIAADRSYGADDALAAAMEDEAAKDSAAAVEEEQDASILLESISQQLAPSDETVSEADVVAEEDEGWDVETEVETRSEIEIEVRTEDETIEATAAPADLDEEDGDDDFDLDLALPDDLLGDTPVEDERDETGEILSAADILGDKRERSTGAAQRARARVLRIKRSELETSAPPVAAPAEMSDLSPEDEADLMAELAEVEADAPRKPAEKPRERATFEQAESTVSRLIETTNTKLEGSEHRRRRSAIAHLKAAVAATVAERRLKGGEDPTAAKAAELAPYRQDLEKVVRPRRTPAEATPRPSAGKMAPLMLVSEQRIDTPKPAAQPSRPRRVSAGNLALKAEEHPEGENFFHDASDFADYAEARGAHGLTDLLEAAAAYLVENGDEAVFSRPDVMRQIGTLPGADAYSREDVLRAFGGLLRDGKIEKIQRGQFTISKTSRFSPDRGA